MVNGASIYSIAWRAVKYIPKATVKISAFKVSVWLFSIIEWCAHVTVTPDLSRIVVLSKGIWKGLKAKISLGGHDMPISCVGVRLLWKKAQKNLKKNRISETINKIMPHRNPYVTFFVWRPWNEPSRATSRHHCALDKIMIVNPRANRLKEDRWNHFTNPDVIAIAPIDAVKGHGLFSTKW